MSEFMKRAKSNTGNNPKENDNQKVRQMAGRESMEQRAGAGSRWAFEEIHDAAGPALPGVPAYLTSLGSRQPRYYMEENNHGPYTHRQGFAGNVAEERTLAAVDTQNQVIQLQHCHIAESPSLWDNMAPLPQDTEKPTMVFETMGTNLNACMSIYDQSKTYKGNTICVFGYNNRDPCDNYDPKRDDPPNPSNKTKVELETELKKMLGDFQGDYQHRLCVFPFIWKKPKDVEASDKYKMPFIEARHTIMERAKEAVAMCCNPEKNVCLYHWIDGDAIEDTSDQIPSKELWRVARATTIKVITGGYDWYHTDKKAETIPEYVRLINLLNHHEGQLRDLYFQMIKTQSHTLTDMNGLQGFYLPEPAFIMNEIAHEEMLGNFKYYKSSNKQDHESMVMTGQIIRSTNSHNKQLHTLIQHSPNFKVKKPIKEEFNGKDTYLGQELFKLLTTVDSEAVMQSKPPQLFIQGLKKLTQSVFGDNWYFSSESGDAEWENYFGQRPPDIGPGCKENKKLLQQWFNCHRANAALTIWNDIKGSLLVIRCGITGEKYEMISKVRHRKIKK